MSVAIAATLLAAGLIDGGFAGFRASLGRSALLEHRERDRLGAGVGTLVGAGLLAPAVMVAIVGVAVGTDLAAYRAGGTAMLWIIGPYSVVMLTAIGAYAVMPWRVRFIATSLILGPLSMLRAPVAVGAAAAGAVAAADAWVGAAAGLAALGVLLVEPLANRVLANRTGDGIAPTEG